MSWVDSGRRGLPMRAHYAAALLAAISAAALAAVNRRVPQPYMDEIFHVPQTQQYCRGNFAEWDPMITTLPGLYCLAYLVAGARHLGKKLLLMSANSQELACDTAFLRSVNLLLLLACFYTLHALLQHLHGDTEAKRAGGEGGRRQQTAGKAVSSRRQPAGPAADITLQSLVLSLYPLHWFFSFLYYTDVGSLLGVLLCQLASLKGRQGWAAVAGFAAVMFRQTNAVWVTFILGAGVLRMVQHQHQHQHPSGDSQASSQSGAPGQTDTRTADGVEGSNSSVATRAGPGATSHAQPEGASLLQELSQVLPQLWQQKLQVASVFWPLLLVPIAFVVFVYWNGGITVGDKAAHQPVKHAAQLLYLGIFIAGLLAPVLLAPSKLQQQLQALQHSLAVAPVQAVASLVVGTALCCAAAHYTTMAHPYLLADNRHYTFYVWRKVWARHWAVKYGLAPVYVACWASICYSLRRRQSWLWLLGFLVCATAVLVPAWLLEFRYFTIPLMLVTLHVPPPTRPQLLLQAAMYAAINAATLHLFLNRPFTWPDGSTARFMW